MFPCRKIIVIYSYAAKAVMGAKSPRVKRIFTTKPKVARRHTESQQILSQLNSSEEEQPTSPTPKGNRRSESVSAATMRSQSLKRGSHNSSSSEQRRGTFTVYSDSGYDVTSPYTQPVEFAPFRLEQKDTGELLKVLKEVCVTSCMFYTYVHVCSTYDTLYFLLQK